MKTFTLRLFNESWHILANECKVDGFGGSEYRHALAKILLSEADFLEDITNIEDMINYIRGIRQ